ncbi:uncharacterized protein LOC122390995 [Amphibalanus amphitrite]|uniref:uncharacterized protein LOC122390995 n=1 Tax=Amphibalanus amphitrite TaxID=1232801 RepID=UPI001C921405|nr:uncharacterized protein LOC122390995 [Amphibalanus amphitrite]
MARQPTARAVIGALLLVLALQTDRGHGQLASQSAVEAAQSTPLSEDRALDLMEDLDGSDNKLTTVTYVGFANFVTTIGGTVVVFMPRTDSGNHIVAPTRTGKSLVRSQAPVFVPGGRVAKTKTAAPLERSAAVFVPKATSKESSSAGASVISASPSGSSSSDHSTATTREFNTNELYPTGLVTSIGGTLVQSDITTVFTTLFYGTYIKGRYAKVARSASSIYHGDISTTAVHPAESILSTQASSKTPGQQTLAQEPAVATASVSNSLGRAVGSDSTAQIIVSDETAEVLKQGRALVGSISPTTTPALFSSHADADEVKSVLKTYYTTYTYFTTVVKDGTSAVRSSLSTVSSVATEQLPAGAVTTETTKLVSSTATVDGREVVSTEQVTKLLLLSPNVATETTTPPKVITKTFFTTYTYLTTSLVGASSIIKSRLVVSSNVVTSTANDSPQLTASVALKSESVSATPQASLNVADVANTPATSEDVATQVTSVPAQVAAAHRTGLISSRTSSVVNDGITTVHSTGYFGTVVNGRYLQLVQSTTSVLQLAPETTVQLKDILVSSSEAPRPRPTALPRIAPAPVSTSSVAETSSSRSSRLFRLPAAIRSGPRSSTTPLSADRTTILTSPSNAVSSALALVSSSIQKSSRALTSTSRAFRQFRRSGGERKAAGLLALLAQKRGLSVSSHGSSDLQSSETSLNRFESSVSATKSQTIQLPVTSAPALVATPLTPSQPISTSESLESIQPTQTRRRVIVKTRRSFRAATGRRPKRPGLRALIKHENIEREESQATPLPTFDLLDSRATEANEIHDEQPIDPTEEPELFAVTDPATTETPAPEPRSQRLLAFGRESRRTGGTRNALPLRRRGGSDRPRGLASRFLAANTFGQEPTEATTTEAATTTTTSTTPKPVTTTTEPTTESPESSGIPFARARSRSRSGIRRLPFLRRRTIFKRDIPYEDYENDAVHRRSKRQAFGARKSSRRSSLRDILSKEQSAAEEEPAEPAVDPLRSRRRSQRPLRRRTQEESVPRARNVSPTPSETEEKERFTLTPNRSRGSSRSSSSTRRAIPGARSRRPVRPEAPTASSSSSDRSSSSSSGKVSLRQRLQQARFGTSGSSSSTSSSSNSGPSSSRRTPSRRQPSVTLPSRTPSRITSPSRGSSRLSSSRRPTTNRRTSLFASRGSSRDSTPSPFEPKIDPTPVLPEGHIIVISDDPITTSIPLVENGRTTYKEVLSATTVTATLEPDQYSVTDVAGELRTHVGFSTAVGAGGLTEVSTLYLTPTEIKTGVYKTTRVRGRLSSTVSSYIQPAFTVAAEVSTVPASPLQQRPGQNNNALMLLLRQLLGGQQPGQPNFGTPPINVPTPKPQQAFRTFSHTTTYVTTLTESALTTVPIFFQGRKTHTVIINKDVNVITATEVLTSSEPIPGQTVAPAAAFGGGGGGGGGGFGNAGFGLTPQQLLLQQLFAQPAQQPLFQQPQLPLIRPTRQPVFAPASQPPQLEELLRQASEAPDGSPGGRVRRHAGRRRAALPSGVERSPPLSEIRQLAPEDPLQFYLMSAMNDVEVAPVTLRATQTLESAGARPSLAVPHVLDTAPSATFVLVKATEVHQGRVASEAEQLSQSSEADSDSELGLAAAAQDLPAPPVPLSDPDDGQGTPQLNVDQSRVHTLYTTFTFIDRFVKDARPVAITTRETISRVTSLAPGQTPPSGTTRRTETFQTTYTYYKTESAASAGGRPRVTSTEEVTTQVVVTEAARLPAVVPRPAAVRPVVLTTMAPQRPTGAAVLTPIVEPSQVTEDEEALNSVVMAATRTFYTTSTFYTTLVEGGSTVVRSRTEVTSRMQTELSTTWLQVATTALSPLVSRTVTWLGQPGYQQDLEDEGEQEQQLVFLTPVRQTAASTVESAGGDSVQDSVQDLDEQSLTSAAATGVVTEEDKNAVLLAVQALVAEADKESTGSDQPASAPTVLIPDTVVSSPGSLQSEQFTADSQAAELSQTEQETSDKTPAPETEQIPEASKVSSVPKPLATKVKSTNKPVKLQVQPPKKPTKQQTPSTSKPSKPQTTSPTKPTKPQTPAPAKPTKPEAASPGKPVKAQTTSKPAKPQAPKPSQFLVAPAPVAAPSPATTTVQTSVQTSTSTSVSESSALSPGLGGLAGGLLGLGGLAAGLIRNVIPLPLPLRRDGSSGAPVGGLPFQIPRPGGRPGARPGARPFRPGFRPSGGIRRHQTSADRNDNGYLVVIGPGGQRIPLNRAQENTHTPPTRRTGFLAPTPQAQPHPQRRPGAPVRRGDHLRRPQPGARPLTHIPPRIDGPRRPVRPGRPGRPLAHPLGRPVGPNHLHRPGRPVSRRPRPHPTGYIAVRPGDPTPPADFKREPAQHQQSTHRVPTQHKQHARPPSGGDRHPQPGPTVHVAPTQPHHGGVRPPPHHAGPGLHHPPQHGSSVGEPHQQHGPNVRPPPHSQQGHARPHPSNTGSVRPPPVNQPVTHGRPSHSEGQLRPQPLHQSGTLRPPLPPNAQRQAISGHQISLQDRPYPTRPVSHQVPPTGAPIPGPTTPSAHSETLYREHLAQAPQLQADALVFKSDVKGTPHPVPGDTAVTAHLPSYFELNSVDQEGPSDDQKSSASVFTNIGPDGNVQRDPEDIVRIITAPANGQQQETPLTRVTPVLVPTLHTIASVEGPNRIVGTNVFKQVGPLQTLNALDLEADSSPSAVGPSQVAPTQATRTVGVVSSSAIGSEQSLTSGPVTSADTDRIPERTVTPGLSSAIANARPTQSFEAESQAPVEVVPQELQTPQDIASVTNNGGAYQPFPDNGYESNSDIKVARPESQGSSPDLFGQRLPSSEYKTSGTSGPSGSSPSGISGSSSVREEPFYPDDTEDQFGSSTNKDNIGNDRESDYNALTPSNAPGAPSLPGLAGINFEGLPVTESPLVDTQLPNDPNQFNDYGQGDEAEYDDSGKPSPTIGYDYSVPQYDPSSGTTISEQYPDGNGESVRRPSQNTLDQTYENDETTRDLSLQSQRPSTPDASGPGANGGIDSLIGEPTRDPTSATADEQGQGDNDFTWQGEYGVDQASNGQAGTTAGSTSATAAPGDFDESAWGQRTPGSSEEEGLQGQDTDTYNPSEETSLPAWSRKPTDSNGNNADWTNRQREQLEVSEADDEKTADGGSVWQGWNERPSESSENQKGVRIVLRPSTDGQSLDGGSSLRVNGEEGAEDFTSGAAQSQNEGAFEQGDQNNDEYQPSSGFGYESTGIPPNVVPTQSSGAPDAEIGDFALENDSTKELNSISADDTTSESIDEHDHETSNSGQTEKPFRGIVRPSVSRRPFRGTARPSITRRPFRGTSRPSVTRRPFRGSRRPAVTRRPALTRRPSANRRPAATRKPFTGIKRPAWAEFHESSDQSEPTTGSDLLEAENSEAVGDAQGNGVTFNTDQEQTVNESADKVAIDSDIKSGAFAPSEDETNETPKATHQEHDLDLDPSIREEWVQTSDDGGSTDNSRRPPGISLASSVEQDSDESASGSRTPGLNALSLPGRRKPSRRPSLADIIRQTLLASRDDSTLVTVELSSSSSLVRISSATISPSRTRIPPGIATSQTTDRRRVPPGIVRPGAAEDEERGAGGLAWPSFGSEYGTESTEPADGQGTGAGAGAWDNGADGEIGDYGWSYGDDYETGTSGPGFGQDYETGTSSPGYYPDYYETGTSASTVEGSEEGVPPQVIGEQETTTEDQATPAEGQSPVLDASDAAEQSESSDALLPEDEQVDQAAKDEAEQTATDVQDSQQPDEEVSGDAQTPETKVDVSLSISTSETSQEVSVEHSVSEAAAPPPSTADAGANEEDPVEVVVGVSTVGEVVADVTEVTTTEQPSSVTTGPEATFEIQDGTKGTSVPREGEDSSSVPSTTSTAAPPTGRGSVAIAGLLIPTQKENDANRGVETPGLEQPLLSEDKEQEDKCPRQCQAAINEVCRKMGGEHRCLCRPGFSRARDSDACEPSLTYQVRMLLDRVNDIPLQYRRPFAEPASPEYRQLAELAAGGLRESLSSSGPLASRLHGATLMEFKRAADLPGVAPSRPQALMADVMVQITDRESKSLDKDGLQVIVEESLRRSNYSLSDRQVVVSPLHGDVTVIDFDECQNSDYNDCHEGAFCFNLVGSFTCSCRDGLVDTGVPSLPGRSCTGEYSGCPECSYSGECYTEPSGEPACRCHRWYAGQRCQVNLRVLLIALASAGALLAALLCVCCYFCCRRRGRRMAAPPLVFSGPGGLWRHRGSRLHQPVADQRAMLDSSSDTSIPVSSRRRPPNGGKRLLPPLSGGSKPSGPGSRSSQQPSAGEAQRPARFLPRPRHKTDAPSGPRSINSQGGGDPAVAPNRTQPQLMGLLHPSEAARGRSAGGTFRAGRTSRSSGRAEPDSQVSHTPAGRSRSSSGGRRPEPEVSQLPSGRSGSRSSDSVSGEPERIECGTHNFFRARTMSDALSFNEELIEPSVRPVARFDTTRSQRSSHAPSSHGYTYEHHTMAERDAASTYVMPETHLFRRAQDSDAQSETSLVEDFPRMDGSSTVSSRRGFR